ncbi:MAG: hypothetical protein WD749_14680 [Phycisphaerales bacterium]
MPLSTNIIAWITVGVQLLLGCAAPGVCLAGPCHWGGKDAAAVGCCGAPAPASGARGCCADPSDSTRDGERNDCSCCVQAPGDPANPGRSDPRPAPGDEVREIVTLMAWTPAIVALPVMPARELVWRPPPGGRSPSLLAVETTRFLI